MKKKFFAAFIGNFLEHYDHALYGLLAPFLSAYFFPNINFVTSLIWIYSLYPLGMIARLLGAWVFGSIGDRKGYSTSLSLTLFGMAFVTTMMGLLPTYQSIGILAPALLLTLRMMQNFFSSSETVGGAIFLLEESSTVEKSLLSSIYDMTSIAGIFLASFSVTMMARYDLINTYWRFLFILASVTALLGVYVRKFKIAPRPLPTVVGEKNNILSFFTLVLVCGLCHCIYNTVFIIMNGYLPLVSNVTQIQTYAMSTLFLIFDFLLLPFFGWLSSKYTKEKLMKYAMQGIIFLSLPLFYFLQNGSLTTVSVIRFIWVILGASLSAPFYFWASEIIGKEHRFKRMTLGYTIGSQLIGKSSAVIGLWLFQKTGWVIAPALYPLLIAGLAFGLFSSYQSSYLHRPDKRPLLETKH